MSTDPDHLANLDSEIEMLTSAVIDPDRVVPTCPDWTTRQLANHLGSVHRWMAACLRSESVDLPPYPEDRAPEDADGIRDWLVDGARGFHADASALDPDLIRSSWAGPRPVSWFRRRISLETAVHRWDLDNAAGSPRPIPPAVAADGIDEFLDVRAMRESGPTGSIHLHGTDPDVDGEWLIEPGDPLTWSRRHAKGDVAIRATLSDLYLAVWGRLDVEPLDTFGDLDVFRSFAEG